MTWLNPTDSAPSLVSWSGWLNWLSDALYPRRCLGCGRYGTWCCAACLTSLKFTRELHCPDCGEVSALGAFCEACRPDRALAGLWVALPYANPLVRRLVRALKYDGLTEVAPILAQLMSSVMTAWSLPPAWHAVPRERWYLTPVPLIPKRARSRGFNQAELLAELVSQSVKLPVVKILQRTRDTRAQAELPPEQRLTNVSQAFAVSEPCDVAGHAYILVDDVYTSGATLEECAGVLKGAGAQEIWGLAAAKG